MAHRPQEGIKASSWEYVRTETHSKNYRKHWAKNENDDDIANDREGILKRREERRKHYDQIVQDYYILTTANFEFSWGEMFHFCRFMRRGETIYEALRAHEHFLALMAGMKPGMKVLDAGCGIGGPAREMARFTRANITGISINQLHVDRAIVLTKQAGLDHLCSFQQGDFMELPFEDNTFDIVYSIEATVHAPDLTRCYTEIQRVLKPGGIFATYEWLMTHKFDDTKLRHVELLQRIERGDGITNMQTIPEGIQAVKNAGLKMVHHEDMAEHPEDYAPWWWCIDGQTQWTVNWTDWKLIWSLKPWVYKPLYGLAVLLEKLGIAEKGSTEALRTMAMSVHSMRDAAKAGIFTCMYLMVAKKPEK